MSVDDYDFCEECQVAPGEVTNEGSLVCRRCDKELKRQNRKQENAQKRREDRDDYNVTERVYRRGK